MAMIVEANPRFKCGDRIWYVQSYEELYEGRVKAVSLTTHADGRVTVTYVIEYYNGSAYPDTGWDIREEDLCVFEREAIDKQLSKCEKERQVLSFELKAVNATRDFLLEKLKELEANNGQNTQNA